MTGLTAEEVRRLGALPAQVDCGRVRLHREPGGLRALVLWASCGRADAGMRSSSRCSQRLADLSIDESACLAFSCAISALHTRFISPSTANGSRK